MKTSIFVRALIPVAVFALCLVVVYFMIGGDKAPFAFSLFGIPWTIIFDFDPSFDKPSWFQKFIIDQYGGAIFNALTIYALSLMYFGIKKQKPKSAESK